MPKRIELLQNTPVVTSYKLGNTEGMLINPKHLNNRKPNTKGIIHAYVPGHGGDVWFIEHSDNDIAAYSITEFAILT